MGSLPIISCSSSRPDFEGKEEDIKVPDEPIIVDNIWEKYKEVKSLDKGSSSHVFLVEERETETEYALKVMDFKYKSFFEAEFEVLKQVNCRNIVKLVTAYVDEEKEKHYICLNYCSGKSLCDRLTNWQVAYTEGVAAKSVKDILVALKYLHDKNIVHRDVKLDNLVFRSMNDEALVLLDFGLAETVNPSRCYSPAGGTPLYMAPEVIPSEYEVLGETLVKSDMWALGVCAYAILNGCLPFNSCKNDLEDLWDVLKNKPLHFKNEKLSLEARNFLSKLLERDVEKRMSAEEALREPWIVKSGMNDTEILASTVSALRLFTARNSFRRALQSLAANLVTDPDKEYLKNLFQQFDLNNDGEISKDECVTVLENMIGTSQWSYIASCFKINLSAHEDLSIQRQASHLANEIIKHSDENKDQLVSWEEFQHAIARCELSKDERKMYAVFATLDQNGDGVISMEELKYCLECSEMVKRCSLLESVEQTFTDAADHKGGMKFDTFKDILKDPQVWHSTLYSLQSYRFNERIDKKLVPAVDNIKIMKVD